MDLVTPQRPRRRARDPDLTYWSVGATGGSAPPSMVGQAVADDHQRPGHQRHRASAPSTGGPETGTGERRGRVSETVGGADATTSTSSLRSPGAGPVLRDGGPAAHDRVRHHVRTAGGDRRGVSAAGQRQPGAQILDRPLTIDQYLAAAAARRPLRLFDYCLETDGACAVVVTRAGRPPTDRTRPCSSAPSPQATGATRRRDADAGH